MSIGAPELASWLEDSRRCSFRHLSGLTESQWRVPYLPTVNPFLWELGHIFWFQEFWVLRHALGRKPIRDHPDRVLDSRHVGHEMRWHLELPKRSEIDDYGHAVRDAVLEVLAKHELTDQLRYLIHLSLCHEDMHGEAFHYMRQTLGYPTPEWLDSTPARTAQPPTGDVVIPGGRVELGAREDEPFVFDNEKWAHMVDVKPFAIACSPVTQAQYLEFVQDRGYQRPELWSELGWSWRLSAGAERPVYWRSDGDRWERRLFDRWVDLEPNVPMVHVSWYEADAWSRWAGRRLPTEAEWETAATAETDGDRLTGAKRRYPWGNEPMADAERACLDGLTPGPVDIATHATGTTPGGCRHMFGNVWEWTASDFLPFPKFSPDAYKEYSVPWWGCRKVIRGGCWATRSRMLRSTLRNYFTPDRRDVFVGFRTCAAST